MGRIAALSECRFVIDVADLSRFAAEAGADPADFSGRLPGERIAVITIAGERGTDWALLSTLLAHTAARSVVVRAGRDLFPIDAIFRKASRAAAVLAEHRDHVAVPMMRADPDPGDDREGLAELQAYQRQLIEDCQMAAGVQSWQNWRARVEDMHKAQQIAQFLVEDARRPVRQGG
jgi:hypothetical protein